MDRLKNISNVIYDSNIIIYYCFSYKNHRIVILPIVISVIWIGGMIDVVKSASFDQLIFTVISAIILLGATLIFTILPAKNDDWNKADERI